MAENLCAECQMCCKAMEVPDLVPPKPENKWCIHVKQGTGCSVYETRPESCRKYQCLWLMTQSLEDRTKRLPPQLRPDRCKVVMNSKDNTLVLKVDAGRPDAYKAEPLQSFLKEAIRAGVKIYVSRGGEHYTMHEVPNR